MPEAQSVYYIYFFQLKTIYLAIKQEYSMIFCYFWHDKFKIITYILLVLNLPGDPKEPQWVVLGATLNWYNINIIILDKKK